MYALKYRRLAILKLALAGALMLGMALVFPNLAFHTENVHGWESWFFLEIGPSGRLIFAGLAAVFAIMGLVVAVRKVFGDDIAARLTPLGIDIDLHCRRSTLRWRDVARIGIESAEIHGKVRDWVRIDVQRRPDDRDQLDRVGRYKTKRIVLDLLAEDRLSIELWVIEARRVLAQIQAVPRVNRPLN